MTKPEQPEVYLARHGETAWSRSGQHTGRTDIPLTEQGEREARALGERLRGPTFDRAWTSPLARASRTADLAGFAGLARSDPDLVEWGYGDYEGLRTAEIHARNPGWLLLRDGAPGGESVEAVGDRADRVIARLREAGGRTLVIGHGHFTRVLAARWLGLPVAGARLLLLGTAALSIVSYDHGRDEPVIRLWNDDRHLQGG